MGTKERNCLSKGIILLFVTNITIVLMNRTEKAFVEFFLPSSAWEVLQSKLDKEEDVIYFAGNHSGEFIASEEDSVNPVTWGTFVGKE